MRKAITALLRFCLRVFYRRIEFVGLDRLPDGAVIFAVNHPNGLVDPLFLLCYAPRPVSFLAKAPIFGYPVIGWFARIFEGIPVYRRQDGTSGSNRETFARAREVLRGGGSIAIFPEGTTHDDPRLRELKTGVARIALGARLEELCVIPTGIYYTAKHIFRSSALVVFGAPTCVQPHEQEEPPFVEVEKLTAAIDEGLDAVTLQADSHAALELIARAEDIFTANEEQPLAVELEVRRRFVDGYRYLRTNDPARLQRLESAIAQFEAELRRAKIGVHELVVPKVDASRLFRVLILFPLAVIGGIISYPAYRLIGYFARRFSKGEGAMIATVKVISALALYPLTYLAIGIAIGTRFGASWGVVATLTQPLLGYVALRVFEDIDDVIGDLRALFFGGYDTLIRQRMAIREEIQAVARELTEPLRQ